MVDINYLLNTSAFLVKTLVILYYKVPVSVTTIVNNDKKEFHTHTHKKKTKVMEMSLKLKEENKSHDFI